MTRFLSTIPILFVWISCTSQPTRVSLQTGADQVSEVVRTLGTQRVAVLTNHTARIGATHIVDTLLSKGIKIVSILAPEHGFRGDADAGELIKDGADPKTGLPVISLYGKSKKPTPEHLAAVDVVVFDIQDVGARFFTYISSLHYLMEACAEQNKKVVILDRPNPNGFVDGPVLQKGLESFVGMHPIPIAHGLTVGEIAQMINGEGWLANGIKCPLAIITLKNWKHGDAYSLPYRPSPNLPNDNSIGWYPSMCLLEGTALSVGRGTLHPFEWVGHPQLVNHSFSFTPQSIPGMSKNPPFENIRCFGIDLTSSAPERKVSLKYLIDFYRTFPDKEKFFIPFFDKLAGTRLLQQQIKEGLTEEEIRATWQADLKAYEVTRKKYLLYP
jgi:uncharacterized protein YbbC (DUF1343 family)